MRGTVFNVEEPEKSRLIELPHSQNHARSRSGARESFETVASYSSISRDDHDDAPIDRDRQGEEVRGLNALIVYRQLRKAPNAAAVHRIPRNPSPCRCKAFFTAIAEIHLSKLRAPGFGQEKLMASCRRKRSHLEHWWKTLALIDRTGRKDGGITNGRLCGGIPFSRKFTDTGESCRCKHMRCPRH